MAVEACKKQTPGKMRARRPRRDRECSWRKLFVQTSVNWHNLLSKIIYCSPTTKFCSSDEMPPQNQETEVLIKMISPFTDIGSDGQT